MIRTVVSTANTTRQFGVGLASWVLHSCCASFHSGVCFPASSAQNPLWYFGDKVSDFSEPRASRAALPLHAARKIRATRKGTRMHMALSPPDRGWATRACRQDGSIAISVLDPLLLRRRALSVSICLVRHVDVL